MQAIEKQVVLVTGSSDGLGRRVAQRLAEGGARVLLHGRSRDKGERVLEEIRVAAGNEALSYYDADLSSLDAVRRLADQVLADQDRLDVLVNNAAVGTGLRRAGRELSADGHDLQARQRLRVLSERLIEPWNRPTGDT